MFSKKGVVKATFLLRGRGGISLFPVDVVIKNAPSVKEGELPHPLRVGRHCRYVHSDPTRVHAFNRGKPLGYPRLFLPGPVI